MSVMTFNKWSGVFPKEFIRVRRVPILNSKHAVWILFLPSFFDAVRGKEAVYPRDCYSITHGAEPDGSKRMRCSFMSTRLVEAVCYLRLDSEISQDVLSKSPGDDFREKPSTLTRGSNLLSDPCNEFSAQS